MNQPGVPVAVAVGLTAARRDINLGLVVVLVMLVVNMEVFVLHLFVDMFVLMVLRDVKP